MPNCQWQKEEASNRTDLRAATIPAGIILEVWRYLCPMIYVNAIEQTVQQIIFSGHQTEVDYKESIRNDNTEMNRVAPSFSLLCYQNRHTFCLLLLRVDNNSVAFIANLGGYSHLITGLHVNRLFLILLQVFK